MHPSNTVPPISAASMAQVAQRLILERGYDAVSVDDVAEAVGTSRAQVDGLFEGKAELFMFPVRARCEQFIAWLSRGEASEAPYARVRRGLLEFADLYQGDAALHHARFRVVEQVPELSAANLELDDLWQASFAAAFIDATSPWAARIYAGMLYGGIRATLRAWYDADCAEELKPQAEELLRMFERALPPSLREDPS